MISQISFHIGYLLSAFISIFLFGAVGVGALALDKLSGEKFEVISDTKTDMLELSHESTERFFNHILEQLPLKLRERIDWEMEYW